MKSYSVGLWYARSAEFYNGPIVQFFGQIRMVPDLIIILLGAIPLFYFLITTYLPIKPVGFKDGEDIYKGKGGIF